MCNLNTLIIRERNSEKINEIMSFLQSVTTSSYISNSNADGVYFSGSNMIYKDTEKLNYALFRQDIALSNFIIAHQRLSTSGFNMSSNQPLSKEGFIFVHNGVISGLGTHNKSDSVEIFEKFIDNLALIGGEDVKTAIENTFNNLSGSFSIFIYDVKTEKLYYFKNDTTKINFYYDNDYLYITTKEDNKNFLHFLGQNWKKHKIKSFKIYEITLKDTINVFKIGKLKHQNETQTKIINLNNNYTNYHYNYYNNWGYDNADKYVYKPKPQEKSFDNIAYTQELKHCSYCARLTDNFIVDIKEYICPDCIIKLHNNSLW